VSDTATNDVPPAQRATTKPTKLSYKESRDLDQLPARIETLEGEQHALAAAMSAPGYHEAGRDRIKADLQRAADLEHELATAYERWAELDARADALRKASQTG
jgi:ABC transport system ATP-binding/permease protein